MAGSRTLKLSILGDVDGLNKSLKTAGGDVDSFGDKVGAAGVKIGKAFAAAAAAAGAAAIAIGIEGVKAAIADEKAQTQLAVALENATGATQAQIKATEQSILQMSLATGVADDELRPALGRLVRSTGDITKAQDLLSTALDISAATGKPVEAIANSLAKAYDGNTAALGKLGVGLSTAELKTMSFEQVQGRLSELFGGAAARNADTYAGKIARVQVAFDETKETIGVALLPILDKLLQFINQNALPAINAFSDAFSLTQGDGLGKVMNDVANTMKKTVQPIFEGVKSVFDSVKTAIMNSKDEFSAFWDVVKYIAPLIGSVLGKYLSLVGDAAEIVLTVIAKVLGAIKPLLNTAIDGINLIIKGYNAVQWGKDIPYVPKIGGGSGSTATGALGNFSMSTGTTMTTTGGGTVVTGGGTTEITGGGSTGLVTSGGSATGGVATVAKKAAEAITNIAGAFDNFTSGTTTLAGIEAASTRGFPFGTSGVNTNTLAGIMAASGTTINVNVSGAIDAEGTARTIVNTLNDSFYRGTGGAGALVAV
jgi:phage-related protein